MIQSQSRTQSHVLATRDDIDTSDASLSYDHSVFDLGWGEQPNEHTRRWVRGLHNEDVWVLVRRMNKEVFELRRSNRTAPGGLDLVIADDSKFSPNKLRSEVERLYMGVMLGLFSFAKGIARIRSWRERRRTATLCTVYFTAWLFDCLFFMLFIILILFVLYPDIRKALLPPAPLSMVDIKDGSLSKPMAGTLGSTDSATGAPQNLKGETVENEASNFVTSVAAIATNLLTGQDPHGAPTDMEGGGKAGLKPKLDVTLMAVAKDKAEGVNRPSEDKTKAPIEETIWKQMTPLLHMLIHTSDTWERFSNILVSTPPFDRCGHQQRLALYIAPLAIASVFVTRDMVLRVITFSLGFALFGQPIMTITHNYMILNGWIDTLHINNHLLDGVPTNLQLALTLLRLGEANKAPIPPPLNVHQAPPDKAISITEETISALDGDDPLGATPEEIASMAEHNPDIADHAGGEDTEIKQAGSHGKKREKVFELFKDSARGAAKVVAGADKLRAKAGTTTSKLRAGVIPSSRDQKEITGPVEFTARFDGQEGFVYVNSGAEVPFVCFNKRSVHKDGDLLTSWKLNIDDIAQLRKHSGYGMKTKLVAGWALNAALYDSLRIVDMHGKSWIVTALPYRDALFNRLCAISRHANWESW